MKIILLGYMASGKSTVGKALADRLDLDFYDLDAYIEQQEKASVSEIFENRGVIYFRKIENKYLNELLQFDGDLILSLGGGTPVYYNHMELLNNDLDAITVYLKLTILTIVKRLKIDKDARPLVAHIDDEQELMEFIGKHLFERAPFYEQAQYSIDGNISTADELVQEIVGSLFQ